MTAQTFTSTAYSATPRVIENGVYAQFFDYSTPAGTSLSASAGAVVVFGPRVQNGTTILNISGCHSSGAATFPFDVGITGTGIAAGATSQFASQKAAGTNAICAKTMSFPYKVSISDDAANQFATIVFTGAPGTDTAVVHLKYHVSMTRDI